MEEKEPDLGLNEQKTLLDVVQNKEDIENQSVNSISKKDEEFVQPKEIKDEKQCIDGNDETVQEAGTSSDFKGTTKGKKGKGKLNWKNRYQKQKQKGSIIQDNLDAKRHAFHPNFKFRTGRKRSQSYPAAYKFFLPKRPRKETFIPPTKFLLGGNISDPLNLNSLQDEDINRAMNAVTPKSSPLPTPPRHKGKIEVIIPPDIRDPLNLLNPVDNAEYEKQLESKGSRRARKRCKAKRKRATSLENQNVSATVALEIKEIIVPSEDCEPKPSTSGESATPSTSSGIQKDLRLDLSHIRGHKRTISESECSTKGKDNKKPRRDFLDKIVSPVIPQPGAWKRMHPWSSGESRGTHQSKGKGRSVPARPSNNTNTNEAKPAIAHMPKFKPQNAKYQYGNYDRYYGYRNLDASVDIRLKVFSINRHLFHHKDILDIGCNVGHITIAVAKDLGAKSITGIDIDKNLISRARKNLKEAVIVPPPGMTPPRDITNSSITSDAPPNASSEDAEKNSGAIQQVKSDPEQPSTSGAGFKKANPHKHTKKIKRHRRSHHKNHADATKCMFPISCPILYGPSEVIGYNLGDAQSMFPQNIVFKECNYILKDENLILAEQAQYDLILCLSVTKWFHLNWGDSGLKMAFKRMFAQLRPGGKLILEAQSLSSYKKKKNLTETIYKNYSAIEFYPNKFRDYLLSPEVGFSKCCVLGVPQHLSKGFRRPIQLFIKGDFTPSKVQWSDTYAPSSHHQMETNIENQPKKVYANAFSPSYHPSNFWGENTPLYGAATPYSPRLDANTTEDSPFYNPRSDSYLPSYTSNSQIKTVYASLSSPQSDYSATPVHVTEGGIPPTIAVYASLTSPASPFLEPSPGDSGTPSHPFTPSHSATYDAQSANKKVYASLPSPQEDRPPVYSPSVACPSKKTAPSGYSPLHTGSMLPGSVPEFTDLENTNSSDSLQAKGYDYFTPTASPSREISSVESGSQSHQSPKEVCQDGE